MTRLPWLLLLILITIWCWPSRFAVADERPSAERPDIVLSEQARQLHAGLTLFDGHNDLPWAFRKRGQPSFELLDIRKPQQNLHTDIPRLRQGGVKAQFWSVFVPADTRQRGESLRITLEQIDFVKRMVAEYPDTFHWATTSADIDAALAAGKIASLVGMEGGHSIENSIGNLRRLYALGARYMTLTHSDTLEWADAATDDPQHDGLTPFGEEVVLEMNRLGMLVDLSHVSDATMRDTLRITKAPIIYSHSSARALCDHPRNVPDDVLPLVRMNGGVIMVNFYSGFIAPAAAERRIRRDALKKDLKLRQIEPSEIEAELNQWDRQNPVPPSSIHDVLDHLDYLIRKTGIDHVGIGSDYDGVDSLPHQLESVATYPLLTQGLLDRGYSADDIRKVMGGNIMRVFRSAEAISERDRGGEKDGVRE